jgi:hypothetical protein
MHFYQHPDSVEEAVENEIVKQALRIAAEKHAKAHKPGDKFQVHFIEDEDGLSNKLDRVGDMFKKKEKKQKKELQPGEKYDEPFHVDTIKGMVGCNCGWHANIAEFLNDDIKEIEESKKSYKQEESYKVDESYLAIPNDSWSYGFGPSSAY